MFAVSFKLNFWVIFMLLSDALLIKKGVTAVIGGGGKTTLISMLADELRHRGRVLVCTTTHFLPPDMYGLVTPSREELKMAFDMGHNPIAMYSIGENGKCGPVDELVPVLFELADYVLVEADGSRGLPLKTPASHEPAVPLSTSHVVCVCGIDGLNKPISEVCHRAELYAGLTGKALFDTVSAKDMAFVLTSKQGMRKTVYGDYTILINKADSSELTLAARSVAELCADEHVVIASLFGDEPVRYVKMP